MKSATRRRARDVLRYRGGATPKGIVRHVLDRAAPGSIILLHPWYASRVTSLAAVGPLVDSLRARGFRVGTVGELLAARSSGAR